MFAAALLAVHHLPPDRQRSAGFGFRFLTEPSFGLARAACEGTALSLMVAAADSPQSIVLDRQGVPATTPGAQALCAEFQRMHVW